MLKTDKILIGVDEYKVILDADMGGTHLGSINQSKSEIKLRVLGYDNAKISKRMYFKVLMHEIVHGFDFNVFFVAEDKEENHNASEDAIDLVTIYILKNLKQIQSEREAIFEEFVDYINACESNMKRIALLFYAILDFIDDNPELVEEFNEVYK